jgi:hypothetical protein
MRRRFCSRFAVRSAGSGMDSIFLSRGPQGRGDRGETNMRTGFFCSRFAVRSAGLGMNSIFLSRGPQGRGYRRGEEGK